MKQIKNRHTGAIILEGEYETFTDLINANSSADLRYADLRYANLRYANLSYAKSGDLTISNVYSIGPIGSRQSILQIWIFEDGTSQYKTGCFTGSEDEFTSAVNNHSMPKHKTDYLAAIQFVNVLKKQDGGGRKNEPSRRYTKA